MGDLLHWRVEEDGTLTPLTDVGEYTIAHLVLDRAGLVYHRRRRIGWEREFAALVDTLESWELEPVVQAAVEARLEELRSWIEPPIFDRARR